MDADTRMDPSTSAGEPSTHSAPIGQAAASPPLWSRWHEATVRYIRAHPSLHGIPYWLAALFTGICAMGYAALIRHAEAWYQHVLIIRPWAVLLLSPALFFLSWWSVYRFAPEAKGSGIPQVLASIETLSNRGHVPFLKELLGLRTALVRVVSSALCVL